MEKNFDWNDAVKLTRAYLQIRDTSAVEGVIFVLVVTKGGIGPIPFSFKAKAQELFECALDGALRFNLDWKVL